MWWPTAGADIDVSVGPLVPGKRFWLELKTTEWKERANRHELFLDLDQLDAYGKQGIPDFYVFPAPPWSGVLGQNPPPAWASPLDPSDFAYQSHSSDRWFAHWLYVIPGSTLRTLVAGYRRMRRVVKKKRGTVVRKTPPLRVAEARSGRLAWHIPSPPKGHVLLWRDFWKKMESCGDSGPFAAQFVLPAGLVTGIDSSPSGTGIVAPTNSGGGSGGGLPRVSDWAAFKGAALSLQKLEGEGGDKRLSLWSPRDGQFTESEPIPARRPARFVWNGDAGRGMVLLTVDALRG